MISLPMLSLDPTAGAAPPPGAPTPVTGGGEGFAAFVLALVPGMADMPPGEQPVAIPDPILPPVRQILAAPDADEVPDAPAEAPPEHPLAWLGVEPAEDEDAADTPEAPAATVPAPLPATPDPMPIASPIPRDARWTPPARRPIGERLEPTPAVEGTKGVARSLPAPAPEGADDLARPLSAPVPDLPKTPAREVALPATEGPKPVFRAPTGPVLEARPAPAVDAPETIRPHVGAPRTLAPLPVPTRLRTVTSEERAEPASVRPILSDPAPDIRVARDAVVRRDGLTPLFATTALSPPAAADPVAAPVERGADPAPAAPRTLADIVVDVQEARPPAETSTPPRAEPPSGDAAPVAIERSSTAPGVTARPAPPASVPASLDKEATSRPFPAEPIVQPTSPAIVRHAVEGPTPHAPIAATIATDPDSQPPRVAESVVQPVSPATVQPAVAQQIAAMIVEPLVADAPAEVAPAAPPADDAPAPAPQSRATVPAPGPTVAPQPTVAPAIIGSATVTQAPVDPAPARREATSRPDSASIPVAGSATVQPAPTVIPDMPVPTVAVAPVVPAQHAAPMPAAFVPELRPVDTARADWIEAMVERVETVREATGGGALRHAAVRLAPDALGSVEVRVEQQAGELRVRLTVETQQARTLLEQATPRLNDLADARGLRLAEASVDLGRHQGERARRPDPDQPLPDAPASALAEAESADPVTGDRIA